MLFLKGQYICMSNRNGYKLVNDENTCPENTEKNAEMKVNSETDSEVDENITESHPQKIQNMPLMTSLSMEKQNEYLLNGVTNPKMARKVKEGKENFAQALTKHTEKKWEDAKMKI